MSVRPLLIAVLLVGCGARKDPVPKAAKDAAAVAPVVAADDATGAPCERLAFADELKVPEASGAALLPIDGADALLVVSDSGNKGAYVIVDPADGKERETGRMPFGAGAGDDVEALAVRDGVIVGITSAGWIRTWKRDGTGFALVDGPYAVAELATGLACDPHEVNCGKNYEALCLRSGPVPAGECVGLAGSKQDGALYCLAETAGRLIATPRSIAVSPAETLTGCDLAPDGAVWAGLNLFGRSMVYRITGWTTPAQAEVREIGSFGPGFPESIAVGADGAVYRFSDMGNSPSMVAKFRCPDAAR